MEAEYTTCPRCGSRRHVQDMGIGRACGWCRGENSPDYWPVPFSVLDKMPELPAWHSEQQFERYSDTVLAYVGSTLNDGTVSHFGWEMARLAQIQKPLLGNGLHWQQVYSESDWTCLWEVSHWMPLPTAPKGLENYEVPEFLESAVKEHLDFHKR